LKYRQYSQQDIWFPGNLPYKFIEDKIMNPLLRALKYRFQEREFGSSVRKNLVILILSLVFMNSPTKAHVTPEGFISMD
jgi:hypothetical protein